MKSYQMNYIVDFRDVDRYQDLTVEALLQALGTVSMNHEILGMHLKPGYMGQWDMAWILYQWKVQIKETKLYARKIRIETGLVLEKGIYCYRFYRLTDLDGHELGQAMAHWVTVNQTKRRISRIPQEVVDILEDVESGDGSQASEGLLNISQTMDRSNLKPDRQAATFEVNLPVLYTDLDSNGHVNNAKYGRWMTDTTYLEDPTFLDRFIFSDIEIVYKKEKAPGGEIRSCLRHEGNVTYHSIYEGNTLLTLGKIKWRTKDQGLGDYSNFDFSVFEKD